MLGTTPPALLIVSPSAIRNAAFNSAETNDSSRDLYLRSDWSQGRIFEVCFTFFTKSVVTRGYELRLPFQCNILQFFMRGVLSPARRQPTPNYSSRVLDVGREGGGEKILKERGRRLRPPPLSLDSRLGQSGPPVAAVAPPLHLSLPRDLGKFLPFIKKISLPPLPSPLFHLICQPTRNLKVGIVQEM